MKSMYLLLFVTASLGACYSDELRADGPQVVMAPQSTNTVLPEQPPECRDLRAVGPPTDHPALRHPVSLVYPPGVVLSTKEYIRQDRLEEAYVRRAEADTDRAQAEARLAAAAARHARARALRAEARTLYYSP